MTTSQLIILMATLLVLGGIAGCILTNIWHLKRTNYGTLRVIENDESNQPYLALEISRQDLATINNGKFITLEIEHISHE